ncbi:MAG: pyridoxamine 5'-phosphate oxidase family protein, partial [Actinomycetota bacterium]
MSVELISDVDALESCVGSRPAGFHLKSISYLDEHCHRLLAVSPFAVVGVVADDGSIRSTAVGGEPGVLRPTGRTELALPASAGLDAADGAAVGILSFVPGYRETLRLNGRLDLSATPTLQLEEAFLHCAKALIRSTFWAEPELGAAGAEGDVTGDRAEADTAGLAEPGVVGFFEACPFVTLSSVDAGGHADVSPKGDPAGLVARVVDERTLAIADRPGNRRTDTMHNLIECDAISVLAMIPGRDDVVEVRGRAGVTTDEAVRASLTVNGKVPTSAVVVTADHVEIRHEPAIGAAGLWDVTRHADPAELPKATRVWVDHVKRNDDPGLAAKAARKAISARALERGIDK